MKKIAFGLGLAMALVGCKASVRVHASAPAAEPVHAPAPERVKAPDSVVGDAVVLPDQIEFERDEARIKQTPKTIDTLEKLAGVMRTHPNITKLRIEGHTDSSGSPKHNDKLSKARAEAVAKWLVAHDIEAGRLVTTGYGSSRPVARNDTAEHRAQNRRTEYYIEELDGKKLDQPTQKVAGSAPTLVGGNTTAN